MSTYSSDVTFTARLLTILFVMSSVGCAVGVPSKPSCEIEISQEIEIQDNAVITLAPRELLEEVSEELVASNKNIELVDGMQFRDAAFPEGGWRLKKLLETEACQRVSDQLNVDYLAIIGALDVSEGEEKGFFFPLLVGAMSVEGTAAITALIVDVRKGEVESKIISKSTGTSHIFHYVIFIAGNEPQVDSEAISGLANAIGSALNELKPQGKVRVAIVAMDQFEVSFDLDEWEAGELTYKNKLAMEIVKERAIEGDKKAQWFLYEVQPNKESLLWLCDEADQGDEKARSELGKLYFYGSDAYREAMNVHIPTDPSRACAWFHLAGQVEITEASEIEEAQVKQKPFVSAEVERTAYVMTPEEIEEAETLVMSWESGQCARDTSQNMMQGHVEDAALERLCAAADLGDFSSREELGRIYFHGSRGIKRNLVKAYMWYRLAEKVYEPPRIMQNNCDAMTTEQRAFAVKLIEEWRPGKCAQDLLLHDH